MATMTKKELSKKEFIAQAEVKAKAEISDALKNVASIVKAGYTSNIVITDSNVISLNDHIEVKCNTVNNEAKSFMLYTKRDFNRFMQVVETEMTAEITDYIKNGLKESAEKIKADLLSRLKVCDLSVLCSPIKSNFIKVELNALNLLKANNLTACNICYNSLITLIEDINKNYTEYGIKLNKLVSLGLKDEAEAFENKLEDICNVSNYKAISSKLYELFAAFSISGKMLKATHIANGVFSIKSQKGSKKYAVDKNSLLNCLNANLSTLFQNASAEDIKKYRQHYNDLIALRNAKIEEKSVEAEAKKETVKSAPLERSLQIDSFKKSVKAGTYINYFNVVYRIISIEDNTLKCYKFNQKSIKETGYIIDQMVFEKLSIVTDEAQIKQLNDRLTAEIMK